MSAVSDSPFVVSTIGAEVRVTAVREAGRMASVQVPEQAARYWRSRIRRSPWFDSERELLLVLSLNARHRVISFSLVSLGTLNETIAHPRDIFRAAIAVNAFGIILIHNHPSGDPSPSNADYALTRRIYRCAEMIQIRFIDHVVVGSGLKHFSFRAVGELEPGTVIAAERRAQRELRKELVAKIEKKLLARVHKLSQRAT